ncbi:MAG: ABC transporter permease, partial [Nitrospirae bacterium]|nr:ABC transporter permease [Nitrospirota bacterium]
RLVRSGILDVLSQDFVRTARAKGLPEKSVILKHVLRNAISPVVTISGPLIAGLITGSFIVEYLFSIPGMGRYFITAVTNRDYPLIMGVTLVYAVVIVLANIFVDLLYFVIDPRQKISEE